MNLSLSLSLSLNKYIYIYIYIIVFFLLDRLPTQGETINQTYYLPKAGERIIDFILLPRILAVCEMQTASSRIWTRVAVSISYQIVTLYSQNMLLCWQDSIFFHYKLSIFTKNLENFLSLYR